MKKTNISLLIALFYICSSTLLLGQKNVTGLVVDAEDGLPLVGAYIALLGHSQGTITDLDGRFSLAVPEGISRAVVTYTAYESQEVELATSFLEIKLRRAAILDEVVVTALGLQRQNRELGYGVQSVSGALLTDVQATNFVDNLSAQFAGLSVTAGATGVGSSSKIVIRGESSFTNNNPLFVVDGIPINNLTLINPTDEAAAGFQEIDFGNGAMDVNPADIASVSVLKGPGAAALYGTRAANGVILIHTKNGGKQQGLGVSFSSNFTVDSPFQLPRYQNTYGQGQGGVFEFVDGLGAGTSDNITYSFGPRLDAGLLIPQFDSPVTLPNGQVVRGGDVAVHGGLPITPTPFVSQPNNVKDFYRTGTTLINNLAFSTGNQKTNFRLSLTDLQSESYIPGVKLDRKTAHAKLQFSPSDRWKVQAGLTYIHTGSDNRPAAGYGSENINYDLTAWLGRQTNINSLRDYWQPGLEGVQQFSYNYTFFDNPFFTLLENRNAFARDRFFGFLSTSYQISPSLSISLRSGMDYSTELRSFRRNFSTNRFPNGAYAEQAVGYREINSDFLLDYRTKIGDFSLNLLGGGNRLDQQADNTLTQVLSLAQPGIFRLSNGASPVEAFDQQANKRINSLYGLAKIGYQDFLFLDVTGRNDWSSALATPFNADNTAFFYPSASLSFVASKVLSLPKKISFLQLRASWAQVGNDTDPYRTAATFVARTPFNGQPTFSEQSLLPNPNLVPEQTRSQEFGFDLRFLDDRLALDLSYYKQQTENQILSLPVPFSSGYRQQIVNGGRVSTEGLELIVSLTPVYTPRFRWTSRFNFSTNRATIEELPAGTDRFTLGYSRVYNSVNQTVFFIAEAGGRLGDIWGTGYQKTADGQFIVDQNGRFIADNELRKLGNANPDFMLGSSHQLQWGRFGLQLLLDWRQGGQLVSRTLSLAAVGGQLEETAFRPEAGIIAEAVVNIGSEEAPNYVPNTTAVSAESYYRQFYDRNHEENNIYDASYLKIRELSLSYQLGAKQLKNSFLSGLGQLKVALVGRNLFAFSAIPHFDPEQFAIQGQSLLGGVEDMAYPSARSLGVQVNVQF